MQTFLPYPDYESSAKALDYRRLGKQRVECKQILSAMRKQSGGWVNHPATRMWRGYEVELATYGYYMCREWVGRGYNDTLMPYFLNILDAADEDGYDPRDPRRVPPWLGDEAFHASHRSNLLRKDPAYYSQFKWSEPPDMEYVWPV
jgi:hypothetical protein